MKRVTLYQIDIFSDTFRQLLSWISCVKEKGFIVTPNVDHIVKLDKDKIFREAYKKASLILPDGKPLLWTSRLVGSPIREKISGSDLFLKLLPFCEENNKSIYLLGSMDSVRQKALRRLADEYPLLHVSGSFSPPIGFETDQEMNNHIIESINKLHPDYLFIFLGAPKQEIWISRNIEGLNIRLAFCLGASLDFFAGEFKRAPVWMQHMGLEWFWRMIFDRRLVKRYLVEDMLPFARLTLREIRLVRLRA